MTSNATIKTDEFGTCHQISFEEDSPNSPNRWFSGKKCAMDL